MQQDPTVETVRDTDEQRAAYEPPRVESVLASGDLEREVMHGIISAD